MVKPLEDSIAAENPTSFVKYSSIARHKTGRDISRPVNFRGGDDGIRTHDPHVANVMLSQLSYIPTKVRIARESIFPATRPFVKCEVELIRTSAQETRYRNGGSERHRPSPGRRARLGHTPNASEAGTEVHGRRLFPKRYNRKRTLAAARLQARRGEPAAQPYRHPPATPWAHRAPSGVQENSAPQEHRGCLHYRRHLEPPEPPAPRAHRERFALSAGSLRRRSTSPPKDRSPYRISGTSYPTSPLLV